MTEKELKRLSRSDLLELLLEQSRENERLRKALKQVTAQLEDRNLKIAKNGTLAEAAMSLSGIFEAAQSACDLYLENIRLKNQEAEDYKKTIRRQLQEYCGTCPVWKALFIPEQTERQE